MSKLDTTSQLVENTDKSEAEGVLIEAIDSNRLSTFRTNHRFARYAEFKTVEEFLQYQLWAKDNGVPLYILGNGSNTLFTHKRIKTLILQNGMKPWMKDLGDGRVEASSAMPIIGILKHCEKQSLDCFYYLASVPAQVGGAIAMNAGGGTRTIFDFVESVTFIDGDEVRTLPSEQIERKHRQTMFTGIHDRLIVSAVFRFPSKELEASEIRKRVEWCHEHQDLSAPNCGSAFKQYYPPILKYMRGLPPGGIRYPILRAQFSRKVNNWIICRSGNSRSIVLLIRVVQLVHRLFGKRAIPEFIEVD